MQELSNFVSLEKILALPWYVGITGLALVAFLVISAFWALLYLHPIRALGRLALAAAIAVILSQNGEAIVRLIDSGWASVQG